jgi:YVTN family beta-propeller protein
MLRGSLSLLVTPFTLISPASLTGIKEEARTMLPRYNPLNIRRVVGCTLLSSVCLFFVLTTRHTIAHEEDTNWVFNNPTNSSLINLSADNTLVSAVNPDDDSVSVLLTDSNTVLAKINVGNQPQSIALDPNNRYHSCGECRRQHGN